MFGLPCGNGAAYAQVEWHTMAKINPPRIKNAILYILKWCLFFSVKTQKKSVQKTMSTHGFSLEKLKLRITYTQHYLFFSIIFSWETETEAGERRTSCFSDLNMWTE